MSKFDEKKSTEQLHALRLKEEEDLVKMLSARRRIPYLDLGTIAIDVDALILVPEEAAREAHLAVIQEVGRKLKVAIRNPESDQVNAVLEDLKRKRYEPQLFMVSMHSLEKAWERYKEAHRAKAVQIGVVELAPEILDQIDQTVKHTKDLTQTLEPYVVSEETEKVTQSLEIILASALHLDASDIHIQPSEANARLRLRLDGVLQDIIFFNLRTYHLLLSRIKLLSGIKLNVHDRAQDGRYTVRLKDQDMEVRTSMLPEPYGDSFFMLFLNPKEISIGLEDLGMQKPVFDLMVKELEKPNGMILNTGPTGSGKTTTLYSFLKRISTPDINTVTIEDPIEYHLKGVTQTQVDKDRGYSFDNGLRSILRQDPDVILVGEIRDYETAEIAMHAALTGHLVFSTLHTNDAAGTIPRLIDLGIKPNIIAPAINVAMAQRLVRRLCTYCREESKLAGEELAFIELHLKTLPKIYEKPDFTSTTVWHEKGCEKCNYTGFQGRIGIFEVFIIDDLLERLILEDPSEARVRKAAEDQSMLTMQQDGILKIFKGITSFAEVERVTGE